MLNQTGGIVNAPHLLGCDKPSDCRRVEHIKPHPPTSGKKRCPGNPGKTQSTRDVDHWGKLFWVYGGMCCLQTIVQRSKCMIIHITYHIFTLPHIHPATITIARHGCWLYMACFQTWPYFWAQENPMDDHHFTWKKLPYNGDGSKFKPYGTTDFGIRSGWTIKLLG